jgi:hypothetical protein
VAQDDDFVFDEDFIRGAARKEASAEERQATAQRVARDHGNVRPFRNYDAPIKTGKKNKPKKARQSIRNPRTVAIALVVFASLGAAAVFNPLSNSPAGSSAQPHPPRAADAQSHRLLPAAKAPAGSGGYQTLPPLGNDGKVIRFSPCQPLHFVVRHDREPIGGPEAITRAFAEISKDTGLSFVNDGSTDEQPTADRPLVDKKRYGNRWAPLLVAWATVAEAPELEGDVDGYAGPRVGEDGAGSLHLVTAQVVLDEAQLTDRRGSVVRAAYLTMLHELGHALGLAHAANDPTALMYPTLTTQQGLGPGDLRGLAFVGAGPCGNLGS